MKKIFFGLACASLSLLAACTDSFLKEEPKSSLEGAAFFSSPKNAEAAVNNLYRGACLTWYTGGSYGGNRMMWQGWRTGLSTNSESYGVSHSPSTRMREFNINPTGLDDADLTNSYNDCMIQIIRANNVIMNVPEMDNKATGITDALKTRYVGEAKFFRAWQYLWLTRNFGDVPLVLNVPTASDNLEVPRTKQATVLAQVIKDLEEASAALEVTKGASQYNNGVRVTKSVSDAALADAYIFSGNFAKAAEVAGRFLPSGMYGGIFKLEQNVIDVSKPLGTGNPGELSAYNILRNINAVQASPANWFGDGSPAGIVKTKSEESVYFYEYLSGSSNSQLTQQSFTNAMDGIPGSKITIFNNAYRPTRRTLDLYEDDDIRGWERQFFATALKGTDGQIRQNNMEGPAGSLSNTNASPYFFFDYGGLFVNANSGRHWAIYRLPEMWLIAAEAIAKTSGVTDEIAEVVAQIRARGYAGKSKDAIKAELKALSVNAFIEEVWKEYLREFPCEYKSWYWMIRTKKYPQTMTMATGLAKGKINFVDLFSVGTGFSQGNYKESDLYMSMGATALSRNPKLADLIQ